MIETGQIYGRADDDGARLKVILTGDESMGVQLFDIDTGHGLSYPVGEFESEVSRGDWLKDDACFDYPTLTGATGVLLTDANRRRRAMLTRVADMVHFQAERAELENSATPEQQAEIIEIYRGVLLRQTDAGWWLNNSVYAISRTLPRMISDEEKARVKALRESGRE